VTFVVDLLGGGSQRSRHHRSASVFGETDPAGKVEADSLKYRYE